MLNLKGDEAINTAIFVEILATLPIQLVHLPSPSIFNTEFHIILLHS